jgi:hypothetical protein
MWQRIANQVGNGRTVYACLSAWRMYYQRTVRYTADPSPQSIVKSLTESNRLIALVRADVLQSNPTKQSVDWVKIAREMGGNRLPVTCFTAHEFLQFKAAASTERHHFTDAENERLRQLIGWFGADHWTVIARQMSSTAGSMLNCRQLRGHWEETLFGSGGERFKRFTAEEDKVRTI